MDKRITAISVFDKESINKIDSLIKKINNKLCKVPYLEEDRKNKDSLPYHITLQTWNENEKEEALKILKQIELNPITIIVDSINIKNSYNNSYNLYFGIEQNEELRDIYEQFYKINNNPKYNPETFVPHITLHCDTDYDNIINIKDTIEQNFKQFEVSFKEIGLFEIYPAKRIK